MEFSTGLTDLLALKPEGITDERVLELGRECGLSTGQARKIRNAMRAANIIEYLYMETGKNENVRIWRIKGISKKLSQNYPRRAGRRKAAK